MSISYLIKPIYSRALFAACLVNQTHGCPDNGHDLWYEGKYVDKLSSWSSFPDSGHNIDGHCDKRIYIINKLNKICCFTLTCAQKVAIRLSIESDLRWRSRRGRNNLHFIFSNETLQFRSILDRFVDMR